MDVTAANTLPKEERLSGKRSISRLMSEGRWGSCPGFKFCCLSGTGEEKGRVMVSVPKRFFKRAVKRNLLKRRIRESWRIQKHQLEVAGGADLLILYNTAEILSFDQVREAVAGIITTVNSWGS